MKLYTFAPDVDPTEDGIVLDCDHVVPSMRGLKHAPSPIDTDVNTATAVTVIGAASLTKIDQSSRTFLSTAAKIWEQSTDTWTARTGTLTTITGRTRFAQYGDVSLAVSKENVLRGTSSGDFSVVTSTATGSTVTAPSASVIETVHDFVFLADTTGVPGFTADSGDRWACCALGDYQNWTPDIGTQAATGRLTSVPGKITAARRFGDQIVMYKRKGMYLGTYTGPPIIWDFREVPAHAGTFCQESVLNIGTPEQPLHFFVGEQDFYLFDGARPIAVGAGVREYFLADLNLDEADKIICLHDRKNTRIYVFYPSSSSSVLDSALVWNYRTKRWGVDNRVLQFAFEYIAPGLTYDSVTGMTYDELGGGAYDDAFLGATSVQPAIFSSSFKLQTLTGPGQSATITSMDFGDDSLFTTLLRLKPKWFTKPTGASVANYYRNSLGDALTLDTNTVMHDSRFDVIRSARWHRFVWTLSGDFELNEVKLEARIDGSE